MGNYVRYKKNRYLHLTVGLIVTAACLWLAVPGSGIQAKLGGVKATIQAFQQAQYYWLLLLMLLLTLFFWIKAYRWRLLLRPIRRFSTYEVVPATMIGFMGNNLLPAHLGELARMYVLGRTYGVSRPAVLSSIMLERILDMAAVMFFFVLTVFFLDLPLRFRVGSLVIGSAGLMVLAFLILVVYRTAKVVAVFERVFAFLPQKTHQRLSRAIEAAARGLETLRQPGRLFYSLVLSLAHWGILGLFTYLSLRAFSIMVPLPVAFLVLAATMAGVMIPAAPGYWGVLQACFILVLKPYGVPQETALASSLYFHVSQYVPVTVVGLLYMARLRMHLKDLKMEAEDDRLSLNLD